MKYLRSLPLVEFARPHTIIGTTLAVFVVSGMAAAEMHKYSLATVLTIYLAALAVNIYIVGLNQLTDVEIDKINKPYLPLAAGSMSWNTALAIVVISGVLALLIAAAGGKYLLATIGVIFVIGSFYSLPPMRFKRSPLLAAVAITTARAVVLNVGVYMTCKATLGGGTSLPPHLLLFIGVMLGFVIVISLMKDIPDLDGDLQHQIATLVARLGARKTLSLCHAILTTCYIAAIGIAFLAPDVAVNRTVLALAHGFAVVVLWARAGQVDADDKDAVYRHYMFIWKLFYFEFAVFAMACYGYYVGHGH
jgi:homogentisate phytyltransferase/homogentisate geranylgeranyltransferase